MPGRVTRRFFVGGAISAFAGAGLAEAPVRSLFPEPRPGWVGRAAALATAPDPADLIAHAKLGGKLGYVVADGLTGEVLESAAPGLGLPPASTAKSLTSYYGLATLGQDFHFTTQLVATGPIEGGVLSGDLVLVGTGDPEIDTDTLAEMVKALKAKGLRRITGRFLTYAGALPYVRAIDPSQPEYVGYNPAVSALNLNYNRVYFQWQKANSGWAVSMDARSDTRRPAVSMAKMSVVTREAPTYTYREAQGGADEWTVASGALGNGGSRWLPVRRPDLYTGEVVQVIAGDYGIKLPKPVAVKHMPAGTVLVSHDSASLSAITRKMLKYSTNLTAEVIGLSASAKRGVSGGLDASARAMSSWAREALGASSIRLVDHSGLSGDSRISAEDMVKLLVHARPGGVLQAHMKTITPVDVKGNALQNPGFAIHAKTGTLNFTSALTGYITPDQGRPLVFSIMSADTARRAHIPREEMERAPGARGWSRRARWLQYQLINRWAGIYTA